ncbi:hypothetical protein ABT297_04075 [Dactylosporangium sp. NPDC000555]|uniref:hypothetical protein n=1 Tax=Dactylosporangium sp. NPDC000555 TaxID=3154260 RepID=UPI00331790DA
MPIIPGAKKVAAGGLFMGERKIARGLYNFATDGGGVGSITLRGDQIPAGAIVVDALINVETAVTSGGSATLAIRLEGAGDIAAAAAVSGAPWSTPGPKRGDFTATSTPIRTTAARNVVATVATAPLTAGKFSVLVEYYELANQT